VTAARFLIEAASFFADHGVQIQRVLTDNAKAYAQSILFAETAASLGITLKRTRRYRPQTNGKVERFHKTCWPSGPMRGPIAPTPSAIEPSAAGCGHTITGDHIPRSTA
jgi:transposase InsO family protein